MAVYNVGDIYLEDLAGGTSDQLHIMAQTANIADGAVTNAKIASNSSVIRFIRTLTSDSDLDNITEPGIYIASADNVPTNAPAVAQMTILVYGTNTSAMGNSVQVVYTISEIYKRFRTSTKWYPWKKMQRTGENTIDEALYGAMDVLWHVASTSGTNNGVTFTKDNESRTWTIDGTSEGANSTRNILAMNTGIVYPLVYGRTYRIDPGGEVPLQIYVYKDGGSTKHTITEPENITITDDMTGLLIRFMIDVGTTVDNVVCKPMMVALIDDNEVTVIEHYYQNTYNINTNPTITTDTNGWLQAVDEYTEDETGKTDMTGAIMSMLTDTGYCHLGEGTFYVSGGIDMPDDSMIEGCGRATKIVLLQQATSDYAIRMCKRNTVANVSLVGAWNGAESTVGTRDGIQFLADWDGEDTGTEYQTEHCMISNVWLANFSHAGLYCHNTSINYARGIHVTNLYARYCYYGIDIDKRSEFNKFTNVGTAFCQIACRNNGGNNTFTACTFHGYQIGFLIETSGNNGHGTVNGCTFCHIGGNEGIAVKVDATVNGFVFANSQFWYNSIYVKDSQGVLFEGCEFGRGVGSADCLTAEIDGGKPVLFIGCILHAASTRPPTITTANGGTVRLVNCYNDVTGEDYTL